MSYKNRYRL